MVEHTSAAYLSGLRQELEQSFNVEELKTLCSDLGVDYEGLPGEGKSGKIREFLSYLQRRNQLDELLAAVRRERPERNRSLATMSPLAASPAAQLKPSSFFLCYSRHGTDDRALARYLHDALTARGHRVFIDQSIRAGSDWLAEIDRQLQASDFLVVLLSPESADSEMVQGEVRRAYAYRRESGRPNALPVRLNFPGLLPYSLDFFLNSFQYITWSTAADNERVAQDILAAAAGAPPTPMPPPIWPAGEQRTYIDGRLVPAGTISPPLPEFDPRILEELSDPEGAVPLRDKFYIERDADAHLNRQMARTGTTTIRAPRQCGKSSLLVRGVHRARQAGVRDVHLDLQRVDPEALGSAQAFLHYLASMLVRKLRLNPAELDRVWSGAHGPQDKLTYFIEDYILPSISDRILLALDEVDRLLATPFGSDFFALIRSWHNSRAFDDNLWARVSFVMVISTEPHLLIADPNQSPFNIGLTLNLRDFTLAQVRNLNAQHGSPIAEADMPQVMHLLGGHPYLTRKALYSLVTAPMTWAELSRGAASDTGPFSDHVRRLHWLLRDAPELRDALKAVIRHNRGADSQALFRLERAGLIRAEGDQFTCRCDLYRQYFKDRL